MREMRSKGEKLRDQLRMIKKMEQEERKMGKKENEF
jgi:hypothetical protein